MKTLTIETITKSVHFKREDLEEILRKHLNSPNAALQLWNIDEDDYDPIVLSMTTTEKKEYQND